VISAYPINLDLFLALVLSRSAVFNTGSG